jgi:hypothetical protein
VWRWESLALEWKAIEMMADEAFAPMSPKVEIPVRNSRRGPNSSQSLPAVGWAIALAKYRLETRTAIRPRRGTQPRSETSAVAISDLLTGLSDAPNPALRCSSTIQTGSARMPPGNCL